MGGDSGPAVTMPACLSILRRHLSVKLLLVGDESLIKVYLKGLSTSELCRIQILHTSAVFADTLRPDNILRSGRDSSLFLAIEQVRSETAEACISAGNTGALMLASRHLLKNIQGIEKPAMIAMLPGSRAGGFTYVLDVGANIETTPHQFFQFAIMGSVLVSAVSGKPRARVALLNIGSEAHKGTPEIRQAATLLAACNDFDYVGFVEGNQIFDGIADVIVCDGFAGNITIKASAGAVKVIENLMHQSIRRRWYYRAFGFCMRPFFRDVRRVLNPSKYNGATLIGVQGVIVKSHGNSDRAGFEQAIEHALRQLAFNVPHLITTQMQKTVDVM
jgi:glycerol-3-phosphate acyltransferase PlsX